MPQTSAAPVVVGTDGSPSSVNAVRAAARQAAMYGRPLRIVHAFNWIPTMRNLPGCQARERADDVLDEAVRLAGGVAPGVPITARMIEGSSTTALLREARTAALLVIGDGKLGAHTWLPSDCGAVQLASRAPCTVLVARARQVDAGPIVVGVDRSAAAVRVLDVAFTVAARRGTSLVVVCVQESPSATGRDDVQALVDDVERRAATSVVPVTVRTATGDPADVLRTASVDAELLVVGPRGDHLGRGLLGPVTQTLLHHASAPLFIVRRPALLSPPDVGRTVSRPPLARR